MSEDNPGVMLSPHCVERFHERFRPALDQIRARRELEMLLALGEIRDEPPAWLAQKMLQSADAYLIVGNDLVLPLADVRFARPAVRGEDVHLARRDLGAGPEAAQRARPQPTRGPASAKAPVIAFLFICLLLFGLAIAALVAIWALVAVVAIRLCVGIIKSIFFLLLGGRR